MLASREIHLRETTVGQGDPAGPIAHCDEAPTGRSIHGGHLGASHGIDSLQARAAGSQPKSAAIEGHETRRVPHRQESNRLIGGGIDPRDRGTGDNHIHLMTFTVGLPSCPSALNPPDPPPTTT